MVKFIDEAKVYVRSGNGGNGCVAFRREKYIDNGGPSGGDGGKGGDIIVVANPHINTLLHFRYSQHFKAKSGEGGKGSNMHGKSAVDIILEVPVGTQIFDEDSICMLHDCSTPWEQYVLLPGGRGGIGNVHFKSSTNQAPRKATKGEPGIEMNIWLKLKILSDVGLVGLPNAGKSTFLSKVSRAHPKIADYPFTTLEPCLGVVRCYDNEFVVADLPGLIEGAHEGHGLGDRFLKHVERCKILLHIIDASAEDVVESYRIIRHEMISYSEQLKDRPEIICLNKCDLVDDEAIQEKKKLLQEVTSSCIYCISAYNANMIQEVVAEIMNVLLKNNGEK